MGSGLLFMLVLEGLDGGKDLYDIWSVLHPDKENIFCVWPICAKFLQLSRKIRYKLDLIVFNSDLPFGRPHFEVYFIICAQSPSCLYVCIPSFEHLSAEPDIFNACLGVEAIMHLWIFFFNYSKANVTIHSSQQTKYYYKWFILRDDVI